MLYTHDAPIGGTAPPSTTPAPIPPATDAWSARASPAFGPDGSEEVLIEDWCQQYPSHSVGSLAFGADGALYVSGGDGASFNWVDYGQGGSPLNPCGDPPGGLGGCAHSADGRGRGAAKPGLADVR